MTLAIRNLLHDRVRLLLAVAGVAFAVFLMVFQGSLLQGFSRAASIVIDATPVTCETSIINPALTPLFEDVRARPQFQPAKFAADLAIFRATIESTP